MMSLPGSLRRAAAILATACLALAAPAQPGYLAQVVFVKLESSEHRVGFSGL